MRTVIYYDYVRNKKSFLRSLLTWVLLSFFVFFVSLLVNHFVPEFNSTYLKWPDMVQEFLGTGNWNRYIYVNVWYLIGIIFSIYMVYTVMTGFTQSLIQEERLETVVYLQNLSLGRGRILLAKLLFRIGYTFVLLGAILLENMLFLVLLKHTVLLSFFARYYGLLFVICLFYLFVAAFMASYTAHEDVCDEHITNILLISVVLSKIGPFVQFVVDLMELRGHEGEIIGTIGNVADKLDVLNLLCPVVWCWSGVQVPEWYWLCGAGLALIMAVGAFWIYSCRKNK